MRVFYYHPFTQCIAKTLYYASYRNMRFINIELPEKLHRLYAVFLHKRTAFHHRHGLSGYFLSYVKCKKFEGFNAVKRFRHIRAVRTHHFPAQHKVGMVKKKLPVDEAIGFLGCIRANKTAARKCNNRIAD